MRTRNLALLVVLAVVGGCTPRGDTQPGERFHAGALFKFLTPRLTHVFKVRNTLDRPVRILGEQHSCSCTKVRLATVELQPGEAADLEMSVDVIDGYSKSSLQCQVQTDHPKFKEWTYQLAYVTFPRATIAPNRVVLREAAEKSSAQPAEIAGETWLETFAPAGRDLPAPESLDTPDGLLIDLDRNPVRDVLPDAVQRARYHLRISVPARTSISTSGGQSRAFNVRLSQGVIAGVTVVWTNRTGVECHPSQVHFGYLSSSSPPKSTRLVVRSDDGSPFRVLGFESSNPMVALAGPFPTKAVAEHLFELSLRPTSEASTSVLSGSVRLKTDRRPVSSIEVPWSVFFSGKGLEGRKIDRSPDHHSD